MNWYIATFCFSHGMCGWPVKGGQLNCFRLLTFERADGNHTRVITFHMRVQLHDGKVPVYTSIHLSIQQEQRTFTDHKKERMIDKYWVKMYTLSLFLIRNVVVDLDVIQQETASFHRNRILLNIIMPHRHKEGHKITGGCACEQHLFIEWICWIHDYFQGVCLHENYSRAYCIMRL